MFRRILIANRGEIAVRIIRTCRAMDIETVAVYSDADAKALHVSLADRAARIGTAPPSESYLSFDRILTAARDTGADAIHPGYGFLSENPAFAAACAAAGIAFIGPPPAAIERMGSKIAARAVAVAAGIPVVPGGVPDRQDDAAIRAGSHRGCSRPFSTSRRDPLPRRTAGPPRESPRTAPSDPPPLPRTRS